MITNKSIESSLWKLVVLFITFLFIGSFVVSGNYLELLYLAVLYSFIFAVKFIGKSK